MRPLRCTVVIWGFRNWKIETSPTFEFEIDISCGNNNIVSENPEECNSLRIGSRIRGVVEYEHHFCACFSCYARLTNGLRYGRRGDLFLLIPSPNYRTNFSRLSRGLATAQEYIGVLTRIDRRIKTSPRHVYAFDYRAAGWKIIARNPCCERANINFKSLDRYARRKILRVQRWLIAIRCSHCSRRLNAAGRLIVRTLPPVITEEISNSITVPITRWDVSRIGSCRNAP